MKWRRLEQATLDAPRARCDDCRMKIHFVPFALLTLSGCGMLLGLDDFRDAPKGSGGGTTSTSTSSSTTGPGAAGAGAAGGAGTSAGGGGATSCEKPACGDPGCAEVVECAPAPPDANWNGPLAVFSGAPETVPKACPAGWADAKTYLGGDINADPLECSCACGPMEHACSVKYAIGGNTGCSSVPTTSITSEACATLPSAVTPTELLTANATSSNQASCGASLQKSLPTAPTASTGALACAPTQPPGGCAGNESCVPRSLPPGFELCVWTAGDGACPVDGYPNKLSGSPFGTAIMDTRDCTGNCSCSPPGPPWQPNCDGTLYVYSSSSCQNGGFIAQIPVSTQAQQCLHPPQPEDVSSVQYVTTNPGACLPSGSATPIGGVQKAMPITFCCR